MRKRLHPAIQGLCGVLRRIRPFFGCLLLTAGCGTVNQTQAQRQPLADATYAKALAHYSEGLLLETERGRTTDVERAFAAAHRLDPDSRHPMDALVMRLLQDGRTREALDLLEAYCRDHPRDVAARCDLARVSEVNDDPARAARYYEEAFRLQPDDMPLALAHIRALFEDKQDAQAIQAMRRLNHDHPCVDTRNLPTFWALQFARHEHAAARALSCIDLAGEIVTGATQRIELRFFYGETALAAGRTNDAIRAFQQTLAQKPTHIHALLNLAHVLYQRDGAAAIAAQAQQMKSTPDDVPGLLTLAALHLAAQDRTNAASGLARAQAAMQAQKMVPTVDIYLLHGSTLDELGRHEEAAAVFQEALQRHPHADAIMNCLAYMWAVENVKLDEAANWAKQAVKQRPNSGAYLDTLGWVRFRQQRFEVALDLLLQARARMPDDPTVLEHVGDVLASLQRTPEAAAYWSRSFAIDPTQTAVAEKLRAVGVNPATIPRLEPKEDAPEEDDADEE